MHLTNTLLSRIFKDSVLYREWKEENSLTIDSTFYSNVEPCDVKAIFGGVGKYQQKNGIQALVFGGAFHTALEAYYNGVDIQTAISLALKDWDDSGIMADLKRNRDSLYDLCLSYFQHQKVSGDHLTPITFDYKGKPTLANEIPFKLKVGSTPTHNFFWKGKIDLIVKDIDGYWLVDHKTTSVMGEQFLDDKHRSNQMVGYTFACRHELGIPVKGVILNVAAIRKSGFEFARFKLPISETAVYEWSVEIDYRFLQLHNLLDRLSKDENRLQFVSVNREACCTKYGKCIFFDVCQALPMHREPLLLDSHIYVASTFDPLKA